MLKNLFTILCLNFINDIHNGSNDNNNNSSPTNSYI